MTFQRYGSRQFTISIGHYLPFTGFHSTLCALSFMSFSFNKQTVILGLDLCSTGRRKAVILPLVVRPPMVPDMVIWCPVVCHTDGVSSSLGLAWFEQILGLIFSF